MRKFIVFMILLITSVLFANHNVGEFTKDYNANKISLSHQSVNISQFGIDDLENATEEQIKEASKNIIAKYSMKIGKCDHNILFERAAKNNGKWYVSFQEYYSEIPILGSKIKFRVNKDGSVNSITAYENYDIKTSSTPTISITEAINISELAFRDKVNLDVENRVMIKKQFFCKKD